MQILAQWFLSPVTLQDIVFLFSGEWNLAFGRSKGKLSEEKLRFAQLRIGGCDMAIQAPNNSDYQASALRALCYYGCLIGRSHRRQRASCACTLFHLRLQL